MPTDTLYLLDSAAAGSGYGDVQIGGVAPAQLTGATRWNVGTLAATRYATMDFGASVSRTAADATYGWQTTPRTNNPDSTRGTAFRYGPFTRDYAATAFAFSTAIRSVAGTAQRGKMRLRVFKSANADGSSPTEIGSFVETGITSAMSTTVDTVITANWTPPAIISLSNEYLFFEIQWVITTAGAGNTAEVAISRGSSTSIVTSNYTVVSLVAVGSERVASWDILANVGSQRAASWDVLAAVGAQRVASWNILALVSAERVASWSILKSIAADRVASWDILALVGAARTASWNVLSLVGAERVASWDIRSLVQSERAALWDVLEAVGSERVALWDILQAIGAGRVASWDVRAIVGAERTALWDLESAMVVVGAERTASWDVLESVGAERAALWDVLALVDAERTAIWDILQVVGAERVAIWNVGLVQLPAPIPARVAFAVVARTGPSSVAGETRVFMVPVRQTRFNRDRRR